MENKDSVIHDALLKLLKPVIRILLRYGYSYRAFNSLAKQLFIDVCYEDFTIDDRKMTASRVSVLTGIDRKEVVKLTSAPQDDTQLINRPINRASRVIGGWLQDNDYLNSGGKPITLPIKTDGISFRTLVSKYGGDITYGPILEELLRIGAVKYVGKDKIKLLAEGYVPVSGELDKLKIMGDSVHDLLNTISSNLDAPKYPRYQREVIYCELSQRSINEFKLVSHDKSQKLLLELNEWLANKLDLDKRLEVTEPHTRVGVGIYYIEDPLPRDVETKE